MPQWGEKPDEALNNAVGTVLIGLEEEVSFDPSFEEVTGVPLDKMVAHSTAALNQVFGTRLLRGLTMDDLIQCYAMGFVIGIKFAGYSKEHTGGEQ